MQDRVMPSKYFDRVCLSLGGSISEGNRENEEEGGVRSGGGGAGGRGNGKKKEEELRVEVQRTLVGRCGKRGWTEAEEEEEEEE